LLSLMRRRVAMLTKGGVVLHFQVVPRGDGFCNKSVDRLHLLRSLLLIEQGPELVRDQQQVVRCAIRLHLLRQPVCEHVSGRQRL